MKNFIIFFKEYWILWLLILILFFVLWIFEYHTEVITYKGVVLQHIVTSDNQGRPNYNTIASYEDGKITNVEGLNAYMVPIGDTVYIKVRVIK